MIIGIGNDIVDIRRIKSVIERHGERFQKRCFTQHEIKKANSVSSKARYLEYIQNALPQKKPAQRRLAQVSHRASECVISVLLKMKMAGHIYSFMDRPLKGYKR